MVAATESEIDKLIAKAAVERYPRPADADYGYDPVLWQEAYIAVVDQRKAFSECVYAELNKVPETRSREDHHTRLIKRVRQLCGAS